MERRRPLRIRGASDNNLTSVDVSFSAGLTAVVGVSGSGKSSLVFDTLYHEARRRFLETLSLGAPQLMMRSARVRGIDGIGPAVAVAQNVLNWNPHSTVATSVGIHPRLPSDPSAGCRTRPAAARLLRPSAGTRPGRRTERRACGRRGNAGGDRRRHDGECPVHPGGAAVSALVWLLLCDRSPALRYRFLTELLEVAESDPEVSELAGQRASTETVSLMAVEPADMLELSWLLCRFANLGVDRSHPRVSDLAERILAQQLADGSFPLSAFRPPEHHTAVPLQVSLSVRGLAAAGYATDPRVEKAYDWLMAMQLEDGSWPTADAHGQPAYVAGYRKLPGAAGCRANTEAALACLVLHPGRRASRATRRALDLLLQRESRDEWALGSEVARLVGVEPAKGFLTFYARFDLAFVLEIASLAGASMEDARVADLVAFLLDLRGENGLWEHPSHPELSRWLTFSLALSLRRLSGGEWAGTALRVPFRPHPRGRRRY